MKARLLVAVASLALFSFVNAQQAAETKPTYDQQEYDASFLTRPDFQKEFGLSNEVVAKLRELYMTNSRHFVATRPPRSVHPTTEEAAINREAITKVIQDDLEQSMAVLTLQQQKRLHEITLQSRGATGVLLPNVKKELGLTPEQITRIGAEIQKVASVKTGWRKGVFEGGASPTMKQMVDGQRDDRKKLGRSIPKILTKEQLKKWKAMLGKPVAENKLFPPLPDMPRPKKK